MSSAMPDIGRLATPTFVRRLTNFAPWPEDMRCLYVKRVFSLTHDCQRWTPAQGIVDACCVPTCP